MSRPKNEKNPLADPRDGFRRALPERVEGRFDVDSDPPRRGRCCRGRLACVEVAVVNARSQPRNCTKRHGGRLGVMFCDCSPLEMLSDGKPLET